MTIILPKKKKAILDYLEDYISQNGFAPTLSEIAKKFKCSSLATVFEHLQFLEENGFIKKVKGKAREIILTDYHAESMKNEGETVSLPLVGLITAGEPIEAIEDKEKTIPVPKELVKNRNSYILKVKGDSMIESLIKDGDQVVVQKTDYARDGDTVVALLDDGTATLKKIYKEKRYIRLQPANKKYKPLKVKNVIIQGKVTGIIRKY